MRNEVNRFDEVRGRMKGIRASVRVPLQLPVEVRWQNQGGDYRQVNGQTGTISGTGMFLTVPARPPRQAPITFKITLPSQVTKVPVEIQGEGRVVRLLRLIDGSGLGVTIDNYELRRVH